MERSDWPDDLDQLTARQQQLGRLAPAPWTPPTAPLVGASYCCADRAADDGRRERERGWAAAALPRPAGDQQTVVVSGELGHRYVPGILALREGPLRAAAVRGLDAPPDVLIVDAAGRDHPRRAGLALHLGAVLDVPTVGATDRPLVAQGAAPSDRRGATSPLRIDGEVVGYWVRVVAGVRPLAVHAGWRTGPEVAVEVVLAEARGHRTPEIMRSARRAARQARTHPHQ